MWEIICAVPVGIPIMFVGFCLWICATIAVLDAARTYAVGESKPLAKMLRRMGK